MSGKKILKTAPITHHGRYLKMITRFRLLFRKFRNKEATNAMFPTNFLLYDEVKDSCIAINIRHYLSDYLIHYGGHIGDGIRPSERRKGYATLMIKLGLEE